jgi:hypothetical protein
MNGLLIRLKSFFSNFSKKPWACFETIGPTDKDQVAFSIHCNKAFIEKLNDMGYAGINDEETVQLFFLQLHMIPDSYSDEVISEAHPNLRSDEK